MGDQEQVAKIFDVLAERYAGRAGGYTRVMKAGFRYGDNAPMAVIELVDRDTEAKGQDSGPDQFADDEFDLPEEAEEEKKNRRQKRPRLNPRPKSQNRTIRALKAVQRKKPLRKPRKKPVPNAAVKSPHYQLVVFCRSMRRRGFDSSAVQCNRLW